MEVIIAPGQRHGCIRIPSSKSVVHRELICAALGRHPVKLRLSGFSKDIRATAECLQALGTGCEMMDGSITLTPHGVRRTFSELPCAESGSTLRFLLPVCGALGAQGAFRMEGRLPGRPMEAYEALLSRQGMDIRHEGDLLFFSGKLRPGEYTMRGNISSQYFSGLLFALPLLDGSSVIRAEGTLESEGYIALTEDALRHADIRFDKQGSTTWIVPGGQTPSLPLEVEAEGDWSNAAFFLCIGALSDRGITVHGLNLRSHQGDSAILDVLTRFGAEVTTHDAEGSVTVKKAACRPMEIDASPIPDLVPVISVLACGADGDTRIYNASRLRLKESDRLHTTASLIRALGGEVLEQEDQLIICGRVALEGGTADGCNDHRIAMSAAVGATLCKNSVTIRGAQCVDKSYPGFWEDLGRCSL